jgi:hypothetical protein
LNCSKNVGDNIEIGPSMYFSWHCVDIIDATFDHCCIKSRFLSLYVYHAGSVVDSPSVLLWNSTRRLLTKSVLRYIL